jgi:membrane fusion protein
MEMIDRADIPLFRLEAIENKRTTWLGDIVLAQPVSFSILTAAAIVTVAILVVFCIVGEYTKKARVSGYLIPDRGLLKVFPAASGIVTALHVSEGEHVKRSQPLATVSAERVNAGGSMQETVAHQLAARNESLGIEIQKTGALFDQQLDAARLRHAQLSHEREQLSRQVAVQQERVKLSEEAYARYARLEGDKFISESALQDKRAELLDQRNRLNDLLRSRASIDRDTAAAEAEISSTPLKKSNSIAALERSRAELLVASAETATEREEVLVAPQGGVVGALQLNVGKQVGPATPVMSIIPEDARLEAELYVPSKAIGFVRPDAVVQLQYQAFPYQKFGSHAGRVARIARTAVPNSELPFPAPPNDVYYVVSVRLNEQYVEAYGKREPLQSGMQLDADIWLDRRTLLEWIMEPLYSASGRL